MNTHLDHCIDNLIGAYNRLGGRHITAQNLVGSITALYTAIEALAAERDRLQRAEDEKHLTEPPCGNYICDCTRHPHTHFHETGCTCWDDYSLPEMHTLIDPQGKAADIGG